MDISFKERSKSGTRSYYEERLLSQECILNQRYVPNHLNHLTHIDHINHSKF